MKKFNRKYKIVEVMKNFNFKMKISLKNNIHQAITINKIRSFK